MIAPTRVRISPTVQEIGAPDFEVALPAADDLPPVLLKLAVPHEDIDDLVALLPARERSPEVWWLLERCAHALVREMGAIGGPPTTDGADAARITRRGPAGTRLRVAGAVPALRSA